MLTNNKNNTLKYRTNESIKNNSFSNLLISFLTSLLDIYDITEKRNIEKKVMINRLK
jgi:hypothetical protein